MSIYVCVCVCMCMRVCVNKENFCSFMLLRNFAWRLQAGIACPAPCSSPHNHLHPDLNSNPSPASSYPLYKRGQPPLHLLWLLSKALSNHIKGNYANIFAAHTSKHILNLFQRPPPPPPPLSCHTPTPPTYTLAFERLTRNIPCWSITKTTLSPESEYGIRN